MSLTRIWLADLLGPLCYAGYCTGCREQFLTRNVYVYHSPATGIRCGKCR